MLRSFASYFQPESRPIFEDWFRFDDFLYVYSPSLNVSASTLNDAMVDIATQPNTGYKLACWNCINVLTKNTLAVMLARTVTQVKVRRLPAPIFRVEFFKGLHFEPKPFQACALFFYSHCICITILVQSDTLRGTYALLSHPLHL